MREAGISSYDIFFVTLVPMVFISIVFANFIHEIGHLIFGKITGHHCAYFRIGMFVLYPITKMTQGNRLQDRRLRLSSFLSGQCIMYKKNYDDVSHYKWNVLGGCIANLLFVVILLPIGQLIDPVFRQLLYVIGMGNLLCGLANLVPRCDIVSNDGMVLKLLNDRTYLRLNYRQMYIAALLVQGYCYSEMDYSLYKLDIDYIDKVDNDILANHLLLNYYYWLDCNNHVMAMKFLNKLSESKVGLSKLMLHDINLQVL